MKLSPIVVFVYNRLSHAKRTLSALQKNELSSESELFIYSDGAKSEADRLSVDEVRRYIDKIEGFKKVTVVKRKKNWGLSGSIIDGVTKIVNKYGKIIVIEDDLVTSPYFLNYMNNSLGFYEKEKAVASIHGYVYPIKSLPNSFFIKGADCWGWATWKDRWVIFEKDGQKLLDELKLRKLERKADFNYNHDYIRMLKDQIKGKNDSWAVRWYLSALSKGMLTLYPGKSYVQNIGNDESGEHCGSTNIYDVELNYSHTYAINIVEDLKSRKKFESFFNSIKSTPIQKIRRIVKRVIF